MRSVRCIADCRRVGAWDRWNGCALRGDANLSLTRVDVCVRGVGWVVGNFRFIERYIKSYLYLYGKSFTDTALVPWPAFRTR